MRELKYLNMISLKEDEALVKAIIKNILLRILLFLDQNNVLANTREI